MIYKDFCGEKVSALGFGTMRLPMIDSEDAEGKAIKIIDQEQVQLMTDMAVRAGVNYFDTAWPYHGGQSELSITEALRKYPRDSYFLADKYPGHQTAASYDPAGIFEKQLEKCGTDYIDFYLLHNVNEGCIDVYKDERWGIVDYFAEQRKAGRIKHLGISTHARAENLAEILDWLTAKLGEHGLKLEFCQIQMNWVDWTLQQAKEKYDILTERNIPIVIMEPVRGGKLADIGEERNAKLKSLRADDSIAAWSFRWLRRFDNIKVVLSGMSDISQMEDNIRSISEGEALDEAESELLLTYAEELKEAVPCTGCRYCADVCPMHLDIPMLINAYNDQKYDERSFTVSIHMEALTDEERPEACIMCGSCAKICPQGIDAPGILRKLSELMKVSHSWAKVCEERAKQK